MTLEPDEGVYSCPYCESSVRLTRVDARDLRSYMFHHCNNKGAHRCARGIWEDRNTLELIEAVAAPLWLSVRDEGLQGSQLLERIRSLPEVQRALLLDMIRRLGPIEHPSFAPVSGLAAALADTDILNEPLPENLLRRAHRPVGPGEPPRWMAADERPARSDEEVLPTSVATNETPGWLDALNAACDGDLRILKRACKKNPDLVNSRWHEVPNYSLLHFAAINGQARADRWLVEHGAELEARDAEGLTPLHQAARERRLASARALLEEGADVDARCVVARTPLHLLLQFLDEAGGSASSEAEDEEPEEPAAQEKPPGFFGRLVGRLFGPGTEPEGEVGDEDRDDEGASDECDGVEIVELLAEWGADLDTGEWDGRTPLIYAVGSENPRAVARLLELGADPNVTDRYGNSPRSEADHNGDPRLVELLDAAGADRAHHRPAEIGDRYVDPSGPDGQQALIGMAHRMVDSTLEAIGEKATSINGEGPEGSTL